MTPFVHLHVHSQYSVLDGQASISSIVDKAMADGMGGVALTDHGTMYGVKEFTNYIKKKNGKTKDAIKEAENAAKKAREEGDEAAAAEAEAQAESLRKKIFKPIIGCEMYVAEKDLHEHIDRRDTDDTSWYSQRTKRATTTSSNLSARHGPRDTTPIPAPTSPPSQPIAKG